MDAISKNVSFPPSINNKSENRTRSIVRFILILILCWLQPVKYLLLFIFAFFLSLSWHFLLLFCLCFMLFLTSFLFFSLSMLYFLSSSLLFCFYFIFVFLYLVLLFVYLSPFSIFCNFASDWLDQITCLFTIINY